MQKEGLKRVLILLGILFIGFIYVGSVSAQDTSSTSSTTTSACPAATPIQCPDNTCAVAATNCPSTTPTCPTTPTKQFWCETQKMCINEGTSCPSCSSTLPIWCPIKNMCVAIAAECTSTSTTSCSSSQRWCASKSMCVDNWTVCDGACGGGNYFCSYSDNSGGWCSSSPCTESQCVSAGKKWCRSSANTCGSASSGWCTYSATETCPPYDKATCEAASGEWCGTWCAQNGSTCPEMRMPSDQTECELYKGTWCPPTQSTMGGATACMMGMCMTAGQSCSKMYGGTCWDGTSMTMGGGGTPCPSMPSTKETCTDPKYVGKVYWCENSGSGWSNGWCSMMPCNKDQCTKAGKYWCDTTGAYSSTNSGWCNDMKCAPMGKMVCPDGDTFVDRLRDCPKKGTEPQKTCADGTKVPLTSVCPEEKKTCPDGSTVAVGAICPSLLTCPSGKKVATLTDCPADDFQTCFGGKKILKGLQCPKGEKEMCNDGVTEKKEGVDCPLTKKEVEDLGKLRDSYVKILGELYTFFNERGDLTLRGKASDLKILLSAAPLTSTGKELIEGKKGAVDLLVGERENAIIEEDKVRDEKNRAKQLQQAKNAIKGLPRAEIQNILNNIKKIETQKVTIPKLGKIEIAIPASLKDIAGSMKDSMDTIDSAKTYDDAENAIKALIQSSSDIESYDKYLGIINTPSQFVRMVNDIQKVITIEDNELANLKKKLKKDEKKELDDTLQEIENILKEVKNNFESFYKGEVLEKDIDEFIEESINGKLEEASSLIGDVQQIQTFQNIVKNTQSKITKYNKELGRVDRKTRELKVQGTIRDEAKKIMEELQPYIIELNKLKRESKSQFEEKILPVVNKVTERTERIDELLNFKKSSSLSKALDAMSINLEKVRSFQMQGLQDQLKGIDTGANFYRGDSRNEVSRIINGKNVSYSKFAAKW